MTKKRFSIALAGLVMVLLVWTVGPGFGVDFNELEQRKTADIERDREQSLLDQRTTLWEGRADDLLFDVVSTNGSLVWVSATKNAIHVSKENGIGIYPGELTQQMPGKILSLTVHPMRHLPKRILISSTIIDGNQLVSHILSYNWKKQQISTFHKSSYKALRPLNKFMYGQSYSANDGWKNTIHQLRTTARGYKRTHELPLPGDAVLLQMEQVSPRVVSYINRRGNFRIVRGQNEIDAMEGDFGQSTRTYRHRANQQDKPYYQVRIPPVSLPSKGFIALANNPPVARGVLTLMEGDVNGSISLFRWDDGGITHQYEIGPMNGRILDIDVSNASPGQLLWLRKTHNDSIVLEMIDFNKFQFK